MLVYVDTSAAMKLVFDEAESDDLEKYLGSEPGGTLVASWLLHAELHCAAGRRDAAATEVLGAVLRLIDLVDINRGDFVTAGTLVPLRAQDAIHLAVAIRLGADAIITYDHELAAAALNAGMRVEAPGQK